MSLEDLKEKVFTKYDINEEKEDSNSKNVSEKVYRFAREQITKIIISDTDSSLVYAIIRVNNHKETIEIKSSMACQWLKASYFKHSNEFHSDDVFSNVLSMIAAESQQDPNIPRLQIYNRIAMTEEGIYYDLCTSKWEAIKITKNGFEIVSLDENTPVFVRRQHQNSQVLPKKQKENALDELCDLLRIQNKDGIVFKVHLISQLLERYPIPIMVVHGEHGSIKSTITKTVNRIVDPSAMNTSSIPRDVSNLILQLNGHYCCNFDNVSNISQEISDILCRGVTGDGVSKRKLYTDSDEVIWKYKRKIVLNGIVPSLEYPDLKERSIFYETIPVQEKERMSEEEFEARLQTLLPSILHEVFTVLSKVLVMYKKVKKEMQVKFRMADFTVFGECISRMLGGEPMSFVKIYKEKLEMDSIKLADSYPIINLISKFMENKDKYESTVRDFYTEIVSMANQHNIEINSKYVRFPKAPNQFSNQINQLKSTLRKYDLEIRIGSYNSRDGKYPRGQSIINITKTTPKQLVLVDRISNG